MIKKFLVGIALLASSAPAFAQINALDSVFSVLKVEATNGGINPAFNGLKFSGRIYAGANECDTARYEVKVEQQVIDGVLTFHATRRATHYDPFCPLHVVPGYPGKSFEQVLIVPSENESNAVIKDVERRGHNVELSSLLSVSDQQSAADSTALNATLDNEDNSEACADAQNTFCLMDYAPAHCTYNGVTVKGSNTCQARNKLKLKVCASESTFDASLIKCTRDGEAQF